MQTHKKGQSATEAAVLVTFLTFFLIITLASVTDDLVHATDDRFTAQLLDLANVIEQEALTAFGSENGYYHAFVLPPTLNGKLYSVGMMNSSSIGDQVNITLLYVSSDSGRAHLNITKVLARDVLGSVSVGPNSIRKENGVVIFTPLPPLLKYVGEPCAANAECISMVCGTDADNDNYFSQALGFTGTCYALPKLYTDCFDFNANAKPGQLALFTVDRGDGSFDYNCDGAQTMPPTLTNSINNCAVGVAACPGCGPVPATKRQVVASPCTPTICGGPKWSCNVQFYTASPGCGTGSVTVRLCGGTTYCNALRTGVISTTRFLEFAAVGCR